MRVLLPVDFSEPARSAFRVALTFAASSKPSAVRLLHVVDRVIYESAYPYVALDKHQARLRAAAERNLEDAAEALRAMGPVEVETSFQLGRPYDETIKDAASWGADVVAMSTHGRGGFERFVLGSVTEAVLRRSLTPVVIAHVPDEQQAGKTPPEIPDEAYAVRRILYPTDLRPLSLNGLCEGVRLAKRFKAVLHILYVHRLPPVESFAEYEHIKPDRSRGWREHEADLRRRLREALSEITEEKVTVEEEVVMDASVDKAIRQVAEDSQADLIVVPSHGRHGLPHFLLGSVAEKVARRANIPVYVFRPEDPEVV
jgi:nucleotide-binding universal stress UspA family protein